MGRARRMTGIHCSCSLSLRGQSECGGFDFTRSLELKPPAIDSRLRKPREKRDLAPAVLGIALVGVAVNEGCGVLVNQNEVRDRPQPGLEVADGRSGPF